MTQHEYWELYPTRREASAARRTLENTVILLQKPLFKLGQVVTTPGAMSAMKKAGQNPWEFLAQHVQGDWGVVGAEDAEANNEALKDGSRLLSAYILKSGEKLWIITEAEDDNGYRATTTLLLPDEY